MRLKEAHLKDLETCQVATVSVHVQSKKDLIQLCTVLSFEGVYKTEPHQSHLVVFYSEMSYSPKRSQSKPNLLS